MTARRATLLTVLALALMGVRPLAFAKFIEDTFSTGSSGDNLNTHTGETGATWTKNPTVVGGSDMVLTDAGRVIPAGSTKGSYYASGTPASAEYDVQATVRRVTTLSD